jgi:hypothetical protein
MTARGRRSRVPRRYTRHGLTPLIKAVRAAGTGVIDRRTGVWRQLSAWRRGVIEDRGGVENLSTLELDTLDQLGKLKLIVDSRRRDSSSSHAAPCGASATHCSSPDLSAQRGAGGSLLLLLGRLLQQDRRVVLRAARRDLLEDGISMTSTDSWGASDVRLVARAVRTSAWRVSLALPR